MCVVATRDARRREMGSTYKGTQWRARRDLLVVARSRGPAGLSVVRYSVHDGELFLGRFPGRAKALCGLTSTLGEKLDLCYGSTDRADRNGLSVKYLQESEVATRLRLDFFRS